MRKLVVTAVVVGSIVYAHSALADEDEAVELAVEGRKRAETGDYQGALELFNRALSQDIPSGLRTDLQCNIGGAYYGLKRWPEAHLFLGQCLSRTAELDDAEFVAAMSKVYAFAEKQLQEGDYGAVIFTVEPAGARVRISALPENATFAAPRAVWLTTGTHRFEVSAPGFAAKADEVLVEKGERAELALTLQRSSAASSPGSPSPSPASLGGPSDTLVTARPSRTGAWISYSVAGAALAGGAVFYFLARDSANDAEPLSADDPRRDELESDFKLRRGLSYGLLAASGVATAVGTYFLLRGSSPEDRPLVGVELSPEAAFVSARLDF